MRRLLCLVAAFLFISSSAALAGPPGKWTRITGTNGINLDQVAFVRGADGALHVVWRQKVGNLVNYRHTAISKAGRAGGSVPVVEGWSTLNNPDLVVAPDGSLRLLFAGIRSTNTGDPYSVGRVTSAVAPPNGSSWTFTGDFHTDAVGVNEYAGPLGAAAKLDGTPAFSWGDQAHIGLDPTPELNLQQGCCTYDSDVAVDAVTGQVVVGWSSNVTNQYGLIVQSIDPSVGPQQYVPGSANGSRTASLAIRQRMAITARLGAPGIYVAYCTGYPVCRTISVWRAGGGKPKVVSRSKGSTASAGRLVNIAAAPKGRLWVMWERGGMFYATRSNPAGKKFGAIVKVKPPKGTSTIWRMSGDGATGVLDVLAHVTARGGLATWHTQIRPGLTLTAKGRATITFKVTDAGVPVKSVRIKVGGRTLRTNARGVAKADLPAGTFTAVATKAGYTKAKKKVKST